MATRLDVLEWIANGENSTVEFKRDEVQPHKLAKELVAFANHDGGAVLLGVADDGAVVGLTRPELEGWVMEVCRSKIRPEIIPTWQVVRDVEPGKDVAIVQVSPGLGVHAVWHDQKRQYYIRVGSQSRDASTEELERLFQRRSGMRAEIRPISGATQEHLDPLRLREYIERVRGQEAPTQADADGWRTLLSNLELLVSDGAGMRCSLLAMLAFGPHPDRFYPQVGFTAAAFPGEVKDYDAVERAALRGPLVGRFADTADGLALVEAGVIEQAVAFVRRHTAGAPVLVAGGVRSTRPRFPEAAVREVLVNAVVHRDYLLTATDIELSIYRDRLEVVSPGILPNGVTVDGMKAGIRATRNPMLQHLLVQYGYVEAFGMGIPRKVIRVMREHNGTEPAIVEDRLQERVRVVLYG